MGSVHGRQLDLDRFAVGLMENRVSRTEKASTSALIAMGKLISVE
jgi:hypothetical protein